MQFCPKCGSILIQKRKNYGCPNCNYSTKEKIKFETKEKIKQSQKIGVIKDKDIDVLPTVEEECKKCGNKTAHFWTSQTRAGDESETKFYRCTKCNATWRDYK